MRFLKVLNIIVLACTLFFAGTAMLNLQPSIAYSLSLLILGIFQFLSGLMLWSRRRKHFAAYLKIASSYLLITILLAFFLYHTLHHDFFGFLLWVAPLPIALYFTYLTFTPKKE